MRGPASRILSSDGFIFSAVSAWAFILRYIYIYEISDCAFFSHPIIDAKTYLVHAVAISSGDIIGQAPFWQAPLYPYFLALLIKVLGLKPFPLYLAQAFIGSLSAGLVFLLGSRAFNRLTGLIAGIAAACYGPFMFYEAQFLVPFLIVFLDLALLLLLVRYNRAPGSSLLAGLCGFLLGLSAVARPNILLFGPACIVWLYLSDRPRLKPSRAVFRILIFTFVTCAVIAAVTLRNYAVSRQFVLVSWNGGANMYIGSNPDWRKTQFIRPGYEWEDLMDEPARHGFTSESGRSKYFYARAFEYAAGNPCDWTRALFYKFYLFWHGHEIIRNLDIYQFRDFSRLLSALVWEMGLSFPFGILSPLALAGIALSFRRSSRGTGRLLSVFVIIYAFSIALFFITGRYRMPVAPAMLILGSSAVVEAGKYLKNGKKARFGFIVVAVFIMAGILNADVLEKTGRDRAEEAYFLGRAYMDKHDLEKAGEWFTKALEIRPGYLEAVSGLAKIRFETGHAAEAERMFLDTLDRTENSKGRAAYEAYINMGTIMQARGDIEAAIRYFESAGSVIPWDPLPGLLIAETMRTSGDRQGAEKMLERLIAEYPDDLNVNIEIVLLDMDMRKMEKAYTLLREISERWPARAEVFRAWGEYYFLLENYEAANDNFRRSLSFDSSQAMVWYRLGLSLQYNPEGVRFGRGFKAAECVEVFSRAWALKPGWGLPPLQIGHALLAAGRIEEAADKYRAALQIDPDLKEASLNLELIREKLSQGETR